MVSYEWTVNLHNTYILWFLMNGHQIYTIQPHITGHIYIIYVFGM